VDSGQLDVAGEYVVKRYEYTLNDASAAKTRYDEVLLISEMRV